MGERIPVVDAERCIACGACATEFEFLVFSTRFYLYLIDLAK
ncbi:MAG: hypothetical protein FJ128_05345 [Deltaproteobacteria bacterium]|nr:hypothetical protein [Deltaproteobacteria bacterium]